MATAFYTQPAAANYYSPAAASHHHKERGYRLCDQCGAVETPSTGRFRLCGGCMATQYCSQACQKAHWANHKPICQHTTTQVSTAKQLSAVYDENMAKYLRKFTSAHQDLLSWVAFQALRLKRVPSNIRSQAVIVELSAQASTDPLHYFSVKGTHVVPRTYVTGNDPLVEEEIKRREDRCRRAGGLGTAIVLIQCGQISQVMPVEVDAPAGIRWDEREDWDAVLDHFVSEGKTDFKPISTTAKGIYYG